MEIIEALLIGFGCALIITNWQLVLAQSLFFGALIAILGVVAAGAYWFFGHPEDILAVALIVLAIISFMKIRESGQSKIILIFLFLSLIAFVYLTLGFGYSLIAFVGSVVLSDYLRTR